jgi:hypothetical protein
MSDLRNIRYATPNLEMLMGWLALDPADDGPFLALNLMKYRERADYLDGRSTTLTGREADDQYNPSAPGGPLLAVGGSVPFVGEVERHLAGDATTWDRVAIARYPTRRSFFEMQQLPEFLELHEHKEAGMETTINLACLGGPDTVATDVPAPGRPDARVLLTVAAPGVEVPDPPSRSVVLADLPVEGEIVGDGRPWQRARFIWFGDADALSAHTEDLGGSGARPDLYAAVLSLDTEHGPDVDGFVAAVAGTPART